MQPERTGKRVDYLLRVAGRLALCSNHHQSANRTSEHRFELEDLILLVPLRLGHCPVRAKALCKGLATYAAGTLVTPEGMGSAGSWEGRAPVHYPGTPSHPPERHTAHVLGRPRADTRGGAIAAECPQRTLEAGLLLATDQGGPGPRPD